MQVIRDADTPLGNISSDKISAISTTIKNRTNLASKGPFINSVTRDTGGGGGGVNFQKKTA